jgi:MFS family permease
MNKSPKSPAAWDVKYEWRALLLLTIGFGLVGLDRFAINTLFPAMMRDMHLTYQDLGNIAAAQALTWGVAAALMGTVSDRFGRRAVIIPSILVFSMMAGFSGLATGIGSLLVLRALMGAAEGAYLPAHLAATIEASKPSRRGLNFGVQATGLPLFGLGIGPILTTQLLAVTGSWRWSFCIVALPGLVLAYLMYRVLRDTQGTVGAAEAPTSSVTGGGWLDALRSRNVVLAVLIMMCVAGGLNIIIAMTPSYIVDFLDLGEQKMGFIMSSVGLGGLIGGLTLPALSDRIGRKPVLLAAAVGATAAAWGFSQAPGAPLLLFLLLTALATFSFGLIPINVGPLTIESSPAHLASTAIGLVAGFGEIVGGAAAPSLAGYIADHYGIEHVFTVAVITLGACAILVCFLKETRPRA